MIDDRELWAVALAVLRQHPDDAPMFTAERLGQLASAGDLDGVEVWREIARRMNSLIFGEGAAPD